MNIAFFLLFASFAAVSESFIRENYEFEAHTVETFWVSSLNADMGLFLLCFMGFVFDKVGFRLLIPLCSSVLMVIGYGILVWFPSSFSLFIISAVLIQISFALAYPSF